MIFSFSCLRLIYFILVVYNDVLVNFVFYFYNNAIKLQYTNCKSFIIIIVISFNGMSSKL